MKKEAKKIILNKLNQLEKSKFRSRFHLNKKMLLYVEEKGIEKIKEHAKEIINKNLGAAYPLHDGKQTPMRNHPVFIAEHATATCCRSCLEKWHGIPKGVPLSENQINYIICLIMTWIKKEAKKEGTSQKEKRQAQLI